MKVEGSTRALIYQQSLPPSLPRNHNTTTTTTTTTMMMIGKEGGWALLRSTNANYPSKTIPEACNEVVIGRMPGCFITVPVPVVSGTHCRLRREGHDAVFLYDLSTNGTFLNNKKLGKGNRALLTNLDEITIVQRQQQQQHGATTGTASPTQ